MCGSKRHATSGGDEALWESGDSTWLGWNVGDEATFLFDKANGVLSMEHTRGEETKAFRLAGLDPTLKWRIHVNLCHPGTTVDLC